MPILGDGRGPFPPQAFFTPAGLPAVPLALDEEEHAGSWFVDLQRAAGLVAIATVVATSQISAQTIQGQFEELPGKTASPGVQQVTFSPTAKESSKLRHFYAAEERPSIVVPLDDDNYVIQLPAPVVAVPQPLVSPDEVPPVAVGSIFGIDDYKPLVNPDAYVIANQPTLGSDELPLVAPSASPGVQVLTLSPTAKPVLSLRLIAGDEALWIQNISVDDVPEPKYDRQTRMETPPTLFTSTDERVFVPTAIPFDDTPEPKYHQQTFVEFPPQFFISTDEIVYQPAVQPGIHIVISPTAKPAATVRHWYVDDSIVAQPTQAIDYPERWVIPQPTDLEQLIPAPWMDGGTDIAAQPVDDVGRTLGQIPETFPPRQAFVSDEDRVIPPPAIHLDDTPQPMYDRQTLAEFPPKVFFHAEERVASILIDDVPRGQYDAQVLPIPQPRIFDSTESIFVPRTIVSDDGVVPDPTQPMVKLHRPFTTTEEIFPHTVGVGYLVGSEIRVHKIQVPTVWRWTIKMSKTNIGSIAPIFSVRLGPTGSLTDSPILTFTLPYNGTGAADDAVVQIVVTVRGPLGPACIAQGFLSLIHNQFVDGFSIIPTEVVKNTSTGFASTATNLIAGIACSITVPMVITFEQVIAERLNV